MGAVTFSIDPRLIKTLQDNLSLDVFVETGTFKGEAIETVKDYFNHIYSIELSKEYYEQAVNKFKNDPKITILHGDSAQLLAECVAKVSNKPIVFWLDAHWCVANATAGELSQCPLLSELSAIKYFHPDSVIIIDDARLFLASPPAPHEITQWPNFHEILDRLNRLNHTHNIMVINDCIIFYPQQIEKAMQSFAHHYGLNWLNVLDKSHDYDKLLSQLIEKEKQIEELKNVCDVRQKALEETTQAIKNTKTNEETITLLMKTRETQENKIQKLTQKVKTFTELEKQCELLTFQLQQSQETIRKSNIGNSAREISFVSDINKHFTEIYTRLTDLHKQAIDDIHAKYEIIRDEKLNLIKPLQKELISHLAKNFSRWKRLREFINLFFTPKLGNLNLYPGRPYKIPEYYKKTLFKKNTPLISIVTPSYNHGNFIEHTIQSVLNQNYHSLEYVIQDGASNDNTVDIIKRYESSLKHWESIKDSGQSNAINLGFRHTTGEIMAYLNSDDILLPGSLEYVANYFAKHPDVDVVYGHRILIDENGLEIGRWVLPRHDNNVLSWADYIPQETLFWRRGIWDKVGGKIDESFRFAMDWDLILRFRDAGANFVRLPRFIGAFRVHPHQKTSTQISQTGFNEMEKLRERCHGRCVSFAETSKATRSYLHRHLIYHRFYRAGLLRY